MGREQLVSSHILRSPCFGSDMSEAVPMVARPGYKSEIITVLVVEAFGLVQLEHKGLFFLHEHACFLVIHGNWAAISIDPIHKSHNAPVPYPTMLRSEQKCAHFCSEWDGVGYGIGAIWDLLNWSFRKTTSCQKMSFHCMNSVVNSPDPNFILYTTIEVVFDEGSLMHNKVVNSI